MKSFVLIIAASAVLSCAVAQRRVARQQPQPEQYGPPAPYQYSYATEDREGSSTAEESTDGSGRVTGKYTISLADGRQRTVTYYADETGFHADVITNELGTESKNPADVTIQSTAPTGAEAALQFESQRVKAKASYVAPVVVPAPAVNAFAALAPVHNRFFRA
ncbi:cuticle protein 10.9-like [Galendromus occidentalis]|uniref:Cuticle protein 10.9-like n=1 Tax=Galendromus occidentalis TaxID=34638 RepID=A0AAJ6VW19_9ACAR|nr:cuticle protein 10.9-like [Galendromus occidentalis]